MQLQSPSTSRITPIVTVIYIRIYNSHNESLKQLLQRGRVHHHINNIVTILVENVRQNGIVYGMKRFIIMKYCRYEFQNPRMKIGKSIL